MKRLLVFCLLAGAAVAQPDVKITYIAQQASVQDIVQTIAAQAGLSYNWQKSFDQTSPDCRRWVRDVRLLQIRFGSAMRQLLQPGGLTYRIEDGAVVLERDPNPPRGVGALLDYTSSGKTVQYVAIDLAEQVGLGYDFNRSFAQTDPDCRKYVGRVAIQQRTFDAAMQQILDPVGLRYQVEDCKVVLYRK
jgi:hypothetical protein